MSTILEELKLIPVKPYNRYKRQEPSFPFPYLELLMGVEFEIENVTQELEDPVEGMAIVGDSSLRNNGLEFVTRPMNWHNMDRVITNFYERFKWNKENYSDRTSTHVHVNCQDITFETLQSVLLLYQCFEPLLFAFVGEERDKNIFCVPWSETNLTPDVIKNLRAGNPKALGKWQKYTALNLLPLFDRGTVEFRHLGSSEDLYKVKQWLALIACIFKYAKLTRVKEIEEDLCDLNTNSQYESMVEKVFGSFAPLLRNENYVELLEEGVLNIKFMLLKNDSQVQAFPDHNGLMQYIEAVQNNLREARLTEGPRVEVFQHQEVRL